jgi:hypothetical protein
MKTKHTTRNLLLLAVAGFFAAFAWSCKDDDPTLEDLRSDKLAYLQDSIKISDSLSRINAAGVVNYAITVVNGSTSTIYKNANDLGRTQGTKNAVSGASVTISQYGKIVTDTTDASGIVVFSGFFRSAANVTIQATDFTPVSYIAAVNIKDSTKNSSISFVGNLIPIFETTGANTSTISGRATIQTDLTNTTRELVADGTTVLASIDALNGDFSDRYLTSELDNIYDTPCGCEILYVGEIMQASYGTGTVGTIAGGNFSITVPSAIDGLPLSLTYSDVAADQTLFETSPFNASTTYRNVFPGNSYSPSAIPAAGSVTISFNAGTGATATGVIALPETLDRINVIAGGSGYSGTPLIEILGGGGTGATATATVTNGAVTGVTLVTPGSGYTAVPTANLISGAGATASSALLVDGTVTGVQITNSGSGYITAPTVTFSAPGGTGTTATGTANIDGAGRVTSVTITDAGSGYTGNPTVIFSAAPAGGTTATANGIYSGQSVGAVLIGAPGANYTYAPTVTFSNPQRANGVVATGTAIIDASTRTVISILITNPGSGYTAAPTVTLNAGSGAALEAHLSGGPLISANIVTQGSNYVAAPIVEITGDGLGATGTAVIAEGKVVGINITNGGTGYSTSTITIRDGAGAQAIANIVDGVITGVTVGNGGQYYTGAPIVTFTSAIGGGASATATVANGAVTGVTIVNGGSGYVEGNTPSGAGQNFSATKNTGFDSKPGLSYINDIYYGTGIRQPN